MQTLQVLDDVFFNHSPCAVIQPSNIQGQMCKCSLMHVRCKCLPSLMSSIYPRLAAVCLLSKRRYVGSVCVTHVYLQLWCWARCGIDVSLCTASDWKVHGHRVGQATTEGQADLWLVAMQRKRRPTSPIHRPQKHLYGLVHRLGRTYVLLLALTLLLEGLPKSRLISVTVKCP